MSRTEFMQALQRALADVSSEEREAALEYYNDYLDDAGPENEAAILREWGSPEKLAESIRSGMDGRLEMGEFTETGFSAGGERGEYPAKYAEWRETGGAQTKRAEEDRGESQSGAGYHPKPEKKQSNGWKILAILLLCILLAPVCIPLVIAAIAVIFSLLVAVAAAVGACAAVGLALFCGGLVLALYGITKIFAAPAGAAVFFGSGLVLAAIGALLTVLFGWILVKCTVWFFRKCVDLCRRPFHGRKKV